MLQALGSVLLRILLAADSAAGAPAAQTTPHRTLPNFVIIAYRSVNAWFDSLPALWKAVIPPLVVAALLAVVAFVFKLPQRLWAGLFGRRRSALVTWKQFYRAKLAEGRFKEKFVAARQEKSDGKDRAIDVVAELEAGLQSAAGAVVLICFGGGGKSRALVELAKRRKNLRFINTSAYGTNVDELAGDLRRKLTRGQVIALDDAQFRSDLVSRLPDILADTGARLVVATREPADADRLESRNLVSVSMVLLGRMENVADIVGATGDRAKDIRRVSGGIAQVAVLAARHGDLSGIPDADALFRSIARDIASKCKDGKLDAIAELALRRGVAEDDPLVKENFDAIKAVSALGYIIESKPRDKRYYIVDPDILAEHLAAGTFFPKGTPSPLLRDIFTRMWPGDAYDALVTLLALDRSHGIASAAETARTLFDVLLDRPDLKDQLVGKEMGFTGGRTRPVARTGEWTEMLLAMVIAAQRSFQRIAVTEGILPLCAGAARLLGNPALLNELGLILMDVGRGADALTCFLAAEPLFAKLNDRRGRAMALGNIGLIYQDKGELDKALEYYKEGLAIQREIGDKMGQAAKLGNIGNIYHLRGELDKALEYYGKALKVFEELGAKKGQASILGNIGLIYQDRGELDKALEYYGKALKAFEELGAKREQASVLGNIGLIYQLKGELDKALENFEAILKKHRESGDRQGEATDLGNIGLVYQDKGEMDKALEYQEKALAIDKLIGRPEGVATRLGNIGNTYVWMARWAMDGHPEPGTDKERRFLDTLRGLGMTPGAEAASKLAEMAVPRLAEALGIFLSCGIADGPRQCRWGLNKCLKVMGKAAFVKACEKAGMSKENVAGLVDFLEKAEKDEGKSQKPRGKSQDGKDEGRSEKPEARAQSQGDQGKSQEAKGKSQNGKDEGRSQKPRAKAQGEEAKK